MSVLAKTKLSIFTGYKKRFLLMLQVIFCCHCTEGGTSKHREQNLPEDRSDFFIHKFIKNTECSTIVVSFFRFFLNSRNLEVFGGSDKQVCAVLRKNVVVFWCCLRRRWRHSEGQQRSNHEVKFANFSRNASFLKVPSQNPIVFFKASGIPIG